MVCRRYIKLPDQTAKNYDQRNYSSYKNPIHHIQAGDVVTEYFFFLLHLICRLAEIIIAIKLCQVFPAAILKHPHIFHLVFDAFFIVIQLVNHFLRLTPLKCIHTRESHSLEFPAFLVSFTQVIFFFFVLHDVKPAKFFFEFFHFVTSCAFRYNLRILFSSSSRTSVPSSVIS